MKRTKYLSRFLRIIVAIIFLQTLYFKFTAHPESVHIFSELGAEPYGRLLLGVVEFFTAFLILIPRTKLIGIVLSLGIISGALLSHFLVLGLNVNGDGGNLFILATVVLIATLLLIILHRNDFFTLRNYFGQ